MVDDLHELLQVRKDGAPHEDGNLLHDLDPSMPGLPGLLGLTHGLQEGNQRGDSQGRGYHGKGAGGGVADVLVNVVDIRPHGGNHGGQPGGFAEVGDDLAPLHPGVVVLVNQQGLDHDQDLVHVRPHQVVQLVQDPVNNLHEKVPLLILQGGGHQQGQDLVKQGPRAQLPCLVSELPEGLLALLRVAVLDLQQKLHNPRLPKLLRGHLVLLLRGQKSREEVVVLGLEVGEVGAEGLGDVHLGVGDVLGDGEPRGEGRGGGGVLAGWGADRHVPRRGLHNLVALLGEQLVELLVGDLAVPVVDLLGPLQAVVGLRGKRGLHRSERRRHVAQHAGMWGCRAQAHSCAWGHRRLLEGRPRGARVGGVHCRGRGGLVPARLLRSDRLHGSRRLLRGVVPALARGDRIGGHRARGLVPALPAA
eukprot:RCo028206